MSLKTMSASDARYVRGICLNDRFIGLINDVGIDGGEIELGYAIHPDYKNKGYASEALKKSIEILFEMGFSVIKAGAFEENRASMRVMEKCGMRRTEEEDVIEYRGESHRCLYYEIKRDL